MASTMVSSKGITESVRLRNAGSPYTYYRKFAIANAYETGMRCCKQRRLERESVSPDYDKVTLGLGFDASAAGKASVPRSL
jgi:hypothetical protein